MSRTVLELAAFFGPLLLASFLFGRGLKKRFPEFAAKGSGEIDREARNAWWLGVGAVVLVFVYFGVRALLS